MTTYDESLLVAAEILLGQGTGRRGRLPSAHVNRSISTTYYALFHFLTAEAATRLAGSGHALRIRRNVLGRAFTHRGLKSALAKVQGQTVDTSVMEFLQSAPSSSAPIAPPSFVRAMARVFADAQAKRHLADYDRNAVFGTADARLLQTRVITVIAGWRAATSPADRDFKHALCVLTLLRGQLRRDD